MTFQPIVRFRTKRRKRLAIGLQKLSDGLEWYDRPEEPWRDPLPLIKHLCAVKKSNAPSYEAAMARYYFNLVTPNESISDLEGSELPSIEEAKAEAIQDARDLMAAAMIAGIDISGRCIEITDGDGEIVLVVSFSEAFSKET